MNFLSDNYIFNEFEAKGMTYTNITSSGTEEKMGIDMRGASEIIMVIDATDAADDLTVRFDAGTGVCGRQVTFKAKCDDLTVLFLSSGEICDDKGKAYFTISSDSALASQNIKAGVIKKLFVHNN